MCSLGDDFETNEKYMRKTEKPNLLSSKCSKCRTEEPKVVLRGKDVYCKECFLAGAVHKFKAVIGKQRIIQSNDRVLVLHKTGHASTALLHLIANGLELKTPKRLKFVPVFVYIEDSFHIDCESRKEVARKIEDDLKSTGLKFYLVSLLNYWDEFNASLLKQEARSLQISNNDRNTIESYIDPKLQSSLYKDVLKSYQRNFLIKIAKHLTCKFIFTPEISIDTASALLSDVALGRGAQLPLDIGPLDTRDDSVTIIRPLRLFTVKELAYYNAFHNLEVTTFANFVNKEDNVQSLIEKFVENLQIHFPATISTIVRTGDKLDTPNGILNKCKICQGTIIPIGTNLSAGEATNFSRYVSHQQFNGSYIDSSMFSTVESEHCFTCRKIKDFILIDK